MNPVAVEQEFQALIATLPLLMSRRTRLLKLCEFFEPLIEGTERQFIIAYAPEALQIIQKDLPHCSAEGTNDHFYSRIERLVKCMRTETSQLLDEPTWDQLIGSCAALREEARKYALRSPRAPLSETQWKYRGKPPAPIVPVVEAEPLVPSLSGNFACLCPLDIEASKKQNGETEDSVFLELYADPEAVQKNTILIASKAAKALFEKLGGKRLQHALNIHCSFGQQGTFVGSSSGLAAAAGLYCELVRLSEKSTQVSILPGIALTGTIDECGNVQPVDVKGLEKKLEACLYSRTRCVVVPKEQILVADAILAGRKEKDNVRPPELIGVTNLEEIFYDRRITHFHAQTFPVRLAKRAWKRRRPLAAALFVMLVAAIVMLLLPRLNYNPVYGEFMDKWLIVKNKYGYELEREEVGSRIVSWSRTPDLSPGRQLRIQAFHDVDGDNENELFYIRRDESASESDRLICRSISRRTTVWEKKLTWSTVFPKKPEATGECVNILGFYLCSVDSTREKRLLLFANSVYFPSVIMKIDPRSGNEEGMYLHVGQLGDMIPVDLDGDGVPELVGTATNNAFQSAAVFVLDPGRMDGCSPTTGDYFPEGYTPAHEKEYVLIPRTLPGEVIRDLYRRNGALTVKCDSAAKRLSVDVNDFAVDIAKFNLTLTANIVVQFDYQLHPIKVGKTNSYDSAVDLLVRWGWMKKVPDAAYFDQYVTTFPRWNGRTFVPPAKSYR